MLRKSNAKVPRFRLVPCLAAPPRSFASDDRQEPDEAETLVSFLHDSCLLTFCWLGREDFSSSSVFLVQPLLTLSTPIDQLAARWRLCSPPHALLSSRGASIPAYTARIPLKSRSTLRKYPSISKKIALAIEYCVGKGEERSGRREKRAENKQLNRGGRCACKREQTNERQRGAGHGPPAAAASLHDDEL